MFVVMTCMCPCGVSIVKSSNNLSIISSTSSSPAYCDGGCSWRCYDIILSVSVSREWSLDWCWDSDGSSSPKELCTWLIYIYAYSPQRCGAVVWVADERATHASVEVGGWYVYRMCTAAAETGCGASCGDRRIHHKVFGFFKN